MTKTKFGCVSVNVRAKMPVWRLLRSLFNGIFNLHGLLIAKPILVEPY